MSGHLERAVQHLTATCTDLGQLARGLQSALSCRWDSSRLSKVSSLEHHRLSNCTSKCAGAPPEELAAAAVLRLCRGPLQRRTSTPTPRALAVDIAVADDTLVVIVVDDGCGGADLTRGAQVCEDSSTESSSLDGKCDRVEPG